MTEKKENGNGMNDQNEVDVSSEKVKKLVKDINITPPDEIKESVFQNTMAEVKRARIKHQRKKRIRKLIKSTGAISGVGAAAALFFILVISETDFDPSSVSQEDPVNQDEEENILMGDDNPQITPPEEEPSTFDEPNEQAEYGETTRQQYKDIVTYPEGMEREATYQLLDDPHLPFSTYYPEEWVDEAIVKDGARGIKLYPDQGPTNNVEIVFFEAGITQEEALIKFEEVVKDLAENALLTKEGNSDELPPWAISSYDMQGETLGMITLGKHEDMFFYFMNQHMPEWGDGWYPIKQVITDEWIWKDSGLTLE
jgi:hypothetical protein